MLNFFRNPIFIGFTLLFIGAIAYGNYIFSKYEFGYEINITSRPGQKKAIFHVKSGMDGTDADFFVKEESKVTYITTFGVAESPGDSTSTIYWSKDGTALITTDISENLYIWDFTKYGHLSSRRNDRVKINQIIESKGGLGEKIVDDGDVVGELRTAYAWEAEELGRIGKWRPLQ